MVDVNPKPVLKTGRLSNKEIDYIRANTGTLPAQDIALYLKRTVESVEEAIRVHCKGGDATTIVKDLHKSEAWRQLQKEFIPEELKYFEEQYLAMVTQFQGDILPSEQTQIFQSIKLEMLMSRNLVMRREARELAKQKRRVLEDFLKGFNGDYSEMTAEDRAYHVNAENQIQDLASAEQSRVSEYGKLQDLANQVMKNMKATRDQRFKKVESEKINFLGILKDFQRRDVQEFEGRQLELAKLAANKEGGRLGDYHTYKDGMVDRPVLNAETVGDGAVPAEGGEST